MRLRTAVAAVLFPALLAACDAAEPEDRGTGWETRAFPLQVCPAGPVTPGIDVSKYQGDINWAKVAGAGIRFAFIRVSDGLDYPDPYYQDNWSEARDAGVVRGTCQFFRASQDPVEQAGYLLAQMGPQEEGDLPPALDIENMDGQPASVVAARMATWIDVVEDALGVEPLICTRMGFWAGMGTGQFASYPLWVANWEVDCPYLPAGWSSLVFWQTSDYGDVAGIDGAVDLDVFNGDLYALLDWAGAAGPPRDPARAPRRPVPGSVRRGRLRGAVPDPFAGSLAVIPTQPWTHREETCAAS